jgi:hypothetical protein
MGKIPESRGSDKIYRLSLNEGLAGSAAFSLAKRRKTAILPLS